ncbi:alpha-hydroxy-acid oxidizing protein [Roseomonas gilardii subsp. gilardii]|uniref:alpha-hydroxy acid oxidase n=1 Tax=Roseomonas gilardii TaxID=257708 RepID=UPI001FF88826|nr:alpha-hydroxy acid oxidase [Roseomonas gilardii]UPG71001.1 alpha-hydroxy-acid oxidizing protein [Roseomonas gilardii subsp. gilardii]
MSFAAPPIPPGIVCAADYEAEARQRMEAAAWAYLSGGSADELTLRWNREGFDRLRLRGRVLADMAGANTRLDLLGASLEHPVLVAPMAFHRLAHQGGEAATALGAAAVGAGMVVSTQSSIPVEEIAAQYAAGGGRTPLWFQLYLQHDRGFTRALIQRAEAAGCSALVLTVDAPVSIRNREARAGFALPPGLEAVHLRGLPPAPPNRAGMAESAVFRGMLDAAPTWRDLEWLRASTRLPILLKGVTDPEDALRAAGEGMAGIILSNHGGRALDTLPATIDLLPPMAERLGGRLPILLDGGIRRGTDIVKALALGAKAVLVGRPVLHALAVGGPVGVAHLLKILRTELEAAMALTGCRDLASIGPEVIWRG